MVVIDLCYNFNFREGIDMTKMKQAIQWLQSAPVGETRSQKQASVMFGVTQGGISHALRRAKNPTSKRDRSRLAVQWIKDAPEGEIRTQKEASEMFKVSQPAISAMKIKIGKEKNDRID